jgi:protein-disulfide isomerase
MSRESRVRARKQASRKKLNQRITIALAVAVVLVIIGLVVKNTGDSKSDSGAVSAELLVRENSLKLTQASTSDVFVEFLDFECESCRAAYPTVDEMKQQYGDRVTFVVRHMPNHFNSLSAARAVEAAAAQGKLEDMVKKMFETQLEWGEKQTSQESTFSRFATEMGLDMTKFRETYNDPAVIEKINADKEDGKKAGVQGTPAFFMNGKQLELTSLVDIKQAFRDTVGN